ncbi:MAG: ABC transporter permease subunit [Pseudomonadota bacterium]
MTTLTDPPQESFRLSMLLNDTRYRSLTFQFIALILLIASMAWLASNAVRNLESLGQDISYEFLADPAGYDINQQPIPFTSQDTHLRASMVGLLNTLIVAFLGCITATVIGIFAGILRLSNNWLVAKLMSVYVEIFRNVPVLIWILIIFSIMSFALPQPREFRGETPTASMVADSFAFTNRGVYVPKPIFTNGFQSEDFADGTRRVQGLGDLAASGALNWIAVLAVLAGAWQFSRWYGRRASAIQEATGERPTTWYVTLAAWALPLIALLWWLGLSFELPELRGFNFQGGIQVRGSLIALWFALSLYTAAFIAENVRAGIQAISKGQTEAAASLGLRPGRIMSLVVLPQALRVIIPPLISQYLNLTKNSSLAIAVGYMDITGTLGGITLNQTGRAIEAILLLMLFYLLVSLGISAIMNVYNNAVKLKER